MPQIYSLAAQKTTWLTKMLDMDNLDVYLRNRKTTWLSNEELRYEHHGDWRNAAGADAP